MQSSDFDHHHIAAKTILAEHEAAGLRGTQPPREYRHWKLAALWAFVWFTLGVF